MADPRRFDWLFRPHARDEDAPLSAEARFAEALAQLPSAERSALALSELGGLGADEIAERLGTDREGAERLVARARATVRSALAGRGRSFLSALLPFQSSGPSGLAAAARTFGAVAVGTVGIGATFDGSGAALLPERDAPRAESRVASGTPHASRASAPVLTGAAPALRLTLATTYREPSAPTVGRRPETPSAPGTQGAPAAPQPDASGPAAPAASPGQVDRSPRLGLVRVVAVARRQVRPDDVRRAVLHLPHVAELVRDEVVGRVRAAQQDRPHERVAVVAAQAGQAEEPGRVDDPHAVDPDRLRIEVEAVEPGLRADEPLVRASVSVPSAG